MHATLLDFSKDKTKDSMKEEHYSVVSESGGHYLFHISPNDDVNNPAANYCSCIVDEENGVR